MPTLQIYDRLIYKEDPIWTKFTDSLDEHFKIWSKANNGYPDGYNFNKVYLPIQLKKYNAAFKGLYLVFETDEDMINFLLIYS